MSQAHPLPCPKIQDLLLPRRPWASLMRNSIKTWIMGTGEIRQRGLTLISFQMQLVKHLAFREHATIRQNLLWFTFIHIKQDNFKAIYEEIAVLQRHRILQFFAIHFFTNLTFISTFPLYIIFLFKEKQACGFMNNLIWITLQNCRQLLMLHIGTET